MKNIFFPILLFMSIFFSAQDRLSFIKNEELKKEVKKSVEYLDKTKLIPAEVRNKVIFITFDFDKMVDEEQTEIVSINYSTYLPIKYSILNLKGEFTTDFQNKIMYFNYSKNVVFIFFKGDEYFEQEQMKKLSNEIRISKENLMKSEYFKYEKGNESTLDIVENFISLEKKNNEFAPVRVNIFDIKIFMKVWYNIDAEEIPVSGNKQNSVKSKQPKKKSLNNFHTHSNNK